MFLHKRVVLRFAAYDISNLNRRIFLEKEQGNIYRVHLLFPNVKYLKFPFESVTPKAVSSYRIKAYFLFTPPLRKRSSTRLSTAHISPPEPQDGHQ